MRRSVVLKACRVPFRSLSKTSLCLKKRSFSRHNTFEEEICAVKGGMLKLLRPGFAAGLRRCSDQKKPDDAEKDEETALPEEPTTCCMSGCANCVWIEYAETLCKHYKDGGKKAREVILSKVTDPAVRSFLMMELQNLENKSE